MAPVLSVLSPGIPARSRKTRQKKRRILMLAVLMEAYLVEWKSYQVFERYYARFEPDFEEWPRQKLEFYLRVRTFEDLCQLAESLRLPIMIRCENGTKFSRVFGLAVVLRRLAFPNRLGESVELLGRDPSQLSRMYNRTIDLIYEFNGQVLKGFNQSFLTTDRVKGYADAVWNSTGIYRNCIGFIDGTIRPICRPSIDQRISYNGHYRIHAVKYQSVVVPDGLILDLAGPFEGRRHDCFMVNKSQIKQRLRDKWTEWGKNFHLYGDKGYNRTAEIQSPFKGPNLTEEQLAINFAMSKDRIIVEQGFGKVSTVFANGNYRENQRLYWQQICKSYIASVLLANCFTCMYGFALVKGRFGLDPPSLSEYLDIV